MERLQPATRLMLGEWGGRGADIVQLMYRLGGSSTNSAQPGGPAAALGRGHRTYGVSFITFTQPVVPPDTT